MAKTVRESPKAHAVPTEPWPTAFVPFYEEHFGHAVRLARLIVGRADVAEELAQDVFVRLSRRWDLIEVPAAYLRRSVVNAATRHLEQRSRERAYVQGQRLADVPGPEVAETLEALERLSPRRRTAIVLRFYEDLSDQEIAQILGCRPVSVRSLIHRALRQLEKDLS